jgi:3-methyladenine DNA glycosylase Mpg
MLLVSMELLVATLLLGTMLAMFHGYTQAAAVVEVEPLEELEEVLVIEM